MLIHYSSGMLNKRPSTIKASIRQERRKEKSIKALRLGVYSRSFTVTHLNQIISSSFHEIHRPLDLLLGVNTLKSRLSALVLHSATSVTENLA